MFGRTSATVAAPSPRPAASPAGGHRAAGALRSEFDQGAEPAALAEVAALAGVVVSLYQQARVDERTALTALAALVLHDDDGTQWSVGAGTMRWYRRLPGGVWRVATPENDISSTLAVAATSAQHAALACLGVDHSQVEAAAAQAPTVDTSPVDGPLEAPSELLLLSFDDTDTGADDQGDAAGGYGD